MSAPDTAEEGRQAEGWLYTSDDGVEWSDNHPVESGEVSDARDVRPATAKALLRELTAAWETYHEQRAALQAAETRAQQAEARVEVLERVRSEIETIAGMGVMATAQSRLDRIYRLAAGVRRQALGASHDR